MGKENERKKENGGVLSKSSVPLWRATNRPYSRYVRTKSGDGGKLLVYGVFGLIYDSRERLSRKSISSLFGKLILYIPPFLPEPLFL